MSDQLKDVSPNVKDLFDKISKLSVSELFDLSEVFKNTYNISNFVASGNSSASSSEPSSVAAEEKTSFNIVLKSFGGNKIAIIKIVKELKGCSLMDAKKIVEATDSVLKENISKKEAEEIKVSIEAAGGVVEIK